MQRCTIVFLAYKQTWYESCLVVFKNANGCDVTTREPP